LATSCPRNFLSGVSRATSNNSFKPNLLRSSKSVAKKTCHAFASTTQVGLIQVLGAAMIFRAALLFSSLFLAGCTDALDVPDDSATAQSRDILVSGYTTPSRVTYLRGDSEACRAIVARSVEVAGHSSEFQPFLDGYSQVRIRVPDKSYRAFFLPERVDAAPYESAFILCAGDSTPISLNCQVIGALKDGCFETGYAWYKLSEIDSLIKGIRGNAPIWGGT
jgi:hypothetical protein